jgi:hypothetical protein
MVVLLILSCCSLISEYATTADIFSKMDINILFTRDEETMNNMPLGVTAPLFLFNVGFAKV